MAVYLYTEESKTGRYNLFSFKFPNGDIYLNASGEDPEEALTTLRSQAKSSTAGKGAKAGGRAVAKFGKDKVKITVYGRDLSQEKTDEKISNLFSSGKIKVNKLINKQIPL